MAARVDRGPPPDPDHWTERGHQQAPGDHPHPARAAGEVAPDPVGLRPRMSSPAETPPSACPPDVLAAVLPVEVTAPRRAADPIAPDRAADGDAPRPAAGRAPVGSVRALDPAWADAKSPRLAPRHNASQHGQRLVPLCRISHMVPLDVVQQVLGVEVGRPAVRASFPCAVTSPIQPRPGADVDRLCPKLIRGQVTAEVPQHVPNVDIGAILRRGAPLGRRLGRRFRGLLRRHGRGRRRPHWWHAWWLRQVQHSPHGKLLIHPAAPRVGGLLPVALDPPPGSGERPEPRPHVLRHNKAEGVSSALPAEACRGRACHGPLEV